MAAEAASHCRRPSNRLESGDHSRESEPLDWQAVSDGDAFADLGGELCEGEAHAVRILSFYSGKFSKIRLISRHR